MPKSASKPFSIRLPDEVRAKLQERATAIGTTESDFVRMLILHELAEAKSPPTTQPSMESRELTALTIAALSDTIEIDEARELVDHFLNSDTQVTS